MAKYKICNQINQMSLVSQLISGAYPHALMNLGAHTVLINIDPNPSDQMFTKCFWIIFSPNKVVSFVGAMGLKRQRSGS